MSYIMDFLTGILDTFLLFIDGIVSFFRLIWNCALVVLDFILEIPTLLELMMNFVADVPAYLAWLPSTAVGVIVITIIVAIIWKIFGRT